MFPKFKAALLPLWAIAGLQLAPVDAAAKAAATPAAAPASAVATSARADPADPKAPVPAALHLSPLQAYRGLAEPPIAPWHETNERVRQRGGWRAYAREAREPDPARPAAPGASQPGAATRPAAGGHSGHETK